MSHPAAGGSVNNIHFVMCFCFLFFFTFSDFGGALLVLSTLTSHSSILLLIKIFWEKMVGFRPADVPPSAAVKFVGAGTAACIADLFTFPLDTAKVRLQVRTVFLFLSALQIVVLLIHIFGIIDLINMKKKALGAILNSPILSSFS